MSQLIVLNGAEKADRDEWLERWHDWTEREVWAHPGYVELFCETDDEPLCICWNEPGAEWIFPLILRPIRLDLGGGETLFDLTGPYGYGGPFRVGRRCCSDRTCWDTLRDWCYANGVVCLFSRLSVFAEQLLPLMPGVAGAGENVVRSLAGTEDRIWMDYEHKVRKNVKRARRDGVRVEVDPDGRYLDRFLEVYRSTMNRRGAGGFFLFDEAWFRKLLASLGEGRLFFHAWLANEIVSTELVLTSRSHVYSFLGGTIAEAFHHRPNDLLKHEIVLWSRRAGKTHFVLGGGFLSGSRSGNDGVLRYKQAFAPDGVVPFKVMRWIIDDSKYRDLVNERKKRELDGNGVWRPREGYFPEYRA